MQFHTCRHLKRYHSASYGYKLMGNIQNFQNSHYCHFCLLIVPYNCAKFQNKPENNVHGKQDIFKMYTVAICALLSSIIFKKSLLKMNSEKKMQNILTKLPHLSHIVIHNFGEFHRVESKNNSFKVLGPLQNKFAHFAVHKHFCKI